MEVDIAAVPNADGSDIRVVSDNILTGQEIEFNADLQESTGITAVEKQQTKAPESCYTLKGLRVNGNSRGMILSRNRKVVIYRNESVSSLISICGLMRSYKML